MSALQGCLVWSLSEKRAVSNRDKSIEVLLQQSQWPSQIDLASLSNEETKTAVLAPWNEAFEGFWAPYNVLEHSLAYYGARIFFFHVPLDQKHLQYVTQTGDSTACLFFCCKVMYS